MAPGDLYVLLLGLCVLCLGAGTPPTSAPPSLTSTSVVVEPGFPDEPLPWALSPMHDAHGGGDGGGGGGDDGGGGGGGDAPEVVLHFGIITWATPDYVSAYGGIIESNRRWCEAAGVEFVR